MSLCDVCNKDFSICDSHHIQSKSKGGKKNKWNIANLCPNCHRLVHSGEIILEGKFLTTQGYIVVWRTEEKESITQVEDPKVFTLKEK